MPAIHTAIEKGHLSKVQALLNKNSELLHQPLSKTDMLQPLHLAAWQGHVDIVRLLIDRGANINARGANGDTPLYYAARYGSVESARLLLAAGADPNLCVLEQWSPLWFAAHGGDKASLEIGQLLLQAGAKPDLNSLVLLGEVGAVCEMISKPNGVEQAIYPQDLWYDATFLIYSQITDRYGYSATTEQEHLVVTEYAPLISCLRSAGADINAVPSGGQPALYLASAVHNLPLIRMLVSNGAEVNLRVRQGTVEEDAFTHARGSDSPPTRGLLLELGFIPSETSLPAELTEAEWPQRF